MNQTTTINEADVNATATEPAEPIKATKPAKATKGKAAKGKATKPAKATKPKAAKGKATKPAKAAKAAVAAVGGNLIPADLSKYVRDSEKRTPAGNVSIHCGDTVATKLCGRPLDEVYTMCSKVVGVPVAELRSRYGHLNPGMQRMNLGNKMRAA